MSIRVLSLAFAVQLQPSEKLLLLALADYADDHGGHIFPSVDTLAVKSCMSRRTVQRRLRDLEDRGLISVVEAATLHCPRHYRIDLPMLLSLTPEESPVPARTGRRVAATDGGVNGHTRGDTVTAEPERGVTVSSRGATMTPNPSVDSSVSKPKKQPSVTATANTEEETPGSKPSAVTSTAALVHVPGEPLNGVPITRDARAAYEAEMLRRWKVPVPWDRTSNSIFKQFVEAMGREVAPKLAAYYVWNNDPLYVKSRHPVNLLLRDRHTLFVNMAAGRHPGDVVTDPRTAGNAAAAAAAARTLLAEARQREGRAHDQR